MVTSSAADGSPDPQFPVLDGHNDLPWALRKRPGGDGRGAFATGIDGTHTDLPRLRAGGVAAQFWSVFVPAELSGEAAVTATLEQIDLVNDLIRRYPAALAPTRTAAGAEGAIAAGRIASLVGAEGGHSIDCSLGVLRALYALGVRYLTLTHNRNVPWADSATDEPAAGGLTAFGRAVTGEMQRLGMLVDLSHVAASTMHDALTTAEAPVIFSHSSARVLCDHPRNVPDDVLSLLPGNGGVCMVTFVPRFVSQRCRDYDRELDDELARQGVDPREVTGYEQIEAEYEAAHPRPVATLAEVADHVDHVREVAGLAHVGLGGDYDGTGQLAEGLEDVSCYPALFAELGRRGWSAADRAALASGNILRVLREAEDAASVLATRRPPATDRIEDLDAPPPALAGPAPPAPSAPPAPGVS